jgi:hypothetical protein
MSHGLGSMQRDILAVYDAFCATERGGRWASPPGVIEAAQMRHEVRRVRTARGERVGSGFHDSFSRALRGLVREGLLVAVDAQGRPPGLFYTNVRFVRKPTVSLLTDT